MTSAVHTVAQITDCHLLADGNARLHGRRPDESLARVLEEVRALHVDLVVASGDLTEEGAPEAYERLRRHLSRLDTDVACIPGNHDDVDLMRERLIGDNVQMPDTVRLGRWRVILVDSTIPGRPDGKVGVARLASLDWHLRESRGSHKIVFVHHQPVDTESPWIDSMGMTDGARFLETLERDGDVAAVAFGHIHHAFSSARDGMQLYGSPSTSFQARPRRDSFELDTGNGPGFRWFRLFADGLLETGVNRAPVGDHA